MKKAIIILLFFGVGIFAAFTLAKDRTTASPEENYQKYCAGCHGERLESFVNRKWLYGNSWREVRSSIKKGIVEDGMPAYDTTFTDKELDELTSYILRGLENFTSDDFEEKETGRKE
jgi:mono/diheme cytochrome c family protein